MSIQGTSSRLEIGVGLSGYHPVCSKGFIDTYSLPFVPQIKRRQNLVSWKCRTWCVSDSKEGWDCCRWISIPLMPNPHLPCCLHGRGLKAKSCFPTSQAVQDVLWPIYDPRDYCYRASNKICFPHWQEQMWLHSPLPLPWMQPWWLQMAVATLRPWGKGWDNICPVSSRP